VASGLGFVGHLTGVSPRSDRSDGVDDDGNGITDDIEIDLSSAAETDGTTQLRARHKTASLGREGCHQISLRRLLYLGVQHQKSASRGFEYGRGGRDSRGGRVA